ncbi:MAG: amidohydrolase family protein, partial [Planctomycetota bacterium]
SFGIWSDDELVHLGRTTDPVLHLEPVLRRAAELGLPFACAHVNDCSDAAIELLAETSTHVVYCPRASAYFAAESHFGPHRYRDMLAAGVRVSLGTDSILNLPADTPSRGMSTLDEARVLFARDACDAQQLLAMATSSSADAIGVDPAAFTLAQGAAPAGVLAVDITSDASKPPAAAANPAAAVLAASAIPEVLFARQNHDLPPSI